MSDELKACPNRECGPPMSLPYDSTEWGEHRVYCDGCGACGPWAKTEPEAVRLWNALPRDEPADAATGPGEATAAPECDGVGRLPCECPARLRSEYRCTCVRECAGCEACRARRERLAAEAERKRREDEAWYYSRVGTAPPRAKAGKGKAAAKDEPRLF